MDIQESIIAEVQRRPALYDKKNKNYCNRGFLNRQWTEIGERLGMDAHAARKKWTGLRDYFTRTSRFIASKPGPETAKRRRWYLYDQMLFLAPYVTESSKATPPNLTDHPDVAKFTSTDKEEQMWDENSGQSQTPPVLETDVADDGAMATTTDFAVGSSSAENGGRRKIVTSFPQERALASNVVKEIYSAVKNISSTSSASTASQSRIDPDDEDEHFFKSLIPKMKTLDPLTKWELQGEIQMLVLRYVKASGGGGSQ